MISIEKQKFPYRDFTHAIEVLDQETTELSREWVKEGHPIGAFKAIRMSLTAFWHIYTKNKPRREDIRGLFLAVHAGMRIFLTYAKTWETQKNQKN